MKTKLIAVLAFIMCFVCNNVKAETTGTKIVGGDLSLVPAYVAAGDSWLKADGTSITTTAQMLAYVKDLGWNSVRVRLFVDPSQDSYAATCQDIDYVKSLGAAIKSAGLNFLLDIHYSDTWADPSNQKIPASWTTTTNMALADDVYSYTKSVLNTLTAANATPDFVQIGNEINGGMLWTTSDGSSPSFDDDATDEEKIAAYKQYGYCPAWQTSRETCAISWERLCRILHAGSKAVRELCPNAKIIVHNAMEGNSTYGCYSKTYLPNFYTYITQSTDYPVYYDIIGLSYYPAWHGTLDHLGQTISALQTSLPTKEIQIVETGWYYNGYPTSAAFTNTTLGWDVSALGQYNYLEALTAKIKSSDYSHVTGLYYWQPEECGNGQGSTTDAKTVMNSWDNRGLWVNSSDASHKLQSAINTTETDVSYSFSNLGFESTSSFKSDWTRGSWDTYQVYYEANSSSFSSLLSGDYHVKAYIPANTTLLATDFLYQTKTMPAGTYKVTAVVHSGLTGIYLKANDNKTEVPIAWDGSEWSTAYEVSVTSTLSEEGSLKIGLYNEAGTSPSYGTNIYADNFTVTKIEGNGETVYPINAITDFSGTYTDDFTSKQTIASESYIGTSDYLTGWWGAFSDTYTLGDKQQYHFNFINHNAGTDNVWNNWVLCAVNGTGHSTTDRSDYAEYFVLRNDNYDLKTGKVVNGLTKNNDTYSITGDESNFITDMNGATVDMYVTYTKGTSIAVNATITATDGDVYTYTYTYDASSVTADNVYLFLTVDHSYIDLKTAKLISTYEETIDDVTYTVDVANGTASVTGYTDALPIDVVVPSKITYNGTEYSVTSIGDNAFSSKTTLNSIHTGNSITSVGANAFDGCTYLNYVCLGTGVTSIGDNAFKDCTNFHVLVLNNTNTITYGTTPFSGVDDDGDANTTSVNTRIYLSSTEYSNILTYKEFGFDNICKTDIQDGIVYALWSDMTASAVGYTENLAEQVRIPSILHYDTNYVPCTQYFMDQIEQYAFAKATVLTNVTVCNNTKKIGMCAFRNCTNLAAVTFGEDMTTFYDNVFYGDSKLKTFTLYADAAPTQWGNGTHTPIQGLSNITLNCPYSEPSTEYTGFSAYNTLTVSNITLDQKETSDLPSKKLIQDNTTGVYNAQKIIINRSLTADNYYTLTLPWDLNASEVTALGITPYELGGKSYIDNNTLHIWFNKITTMQGGVPYLVKVGENNITSINLGLEFTNEYKNLINDASESGGASSVSFIGNYLRMTIPTGAFFISGNLLYYAADETNHLSGFRGYITNSYSTGAKITSMAYDLNDSEATNIISLDAETLTPISNEGYYDVFGRKLSAKPTQAGIYIHNGKKFIIK